MKKQLIALTLATLFSSVSFAQSAPTWNLIEGGYGKADIDDFDEFSPSGFVVLGSALVSDNVFLTGGYSILSEEILGVDIDLDQASVGLGYRYGLTDSTDVYASASYEYVKLSASGAGSEDDNGYGLTIGLRSRLTEQLELDGAIGYVDILDESETAVGVSAHYYFTQNIALGLSYSSTADVNVFAASLRYAF